ncbi:MAG: tRNA (adenosine(37)-N6)-threonylcarbamoyltransferase complex dimerization subunit type 1 TsaB [Verrucomicrobia bacterium]|nr:tRNA (adenosine(37)-N6)-threonylcarbamoyltransferase complex dimerization subunit type 1 TsaB [Verrucomicrobiota bacterium]
MGPSFNRLIIDTSSEHTVMGLAQGCKVLASHIALHANQLSQSLMPTLQSLLSEAGLKLNQLDEIAVGIGPGSYTGTRVGVAIAKSLHFALKKPSLTGFCSLLAFIPRLEGQFACVMPSKTGDFYLLKGVRSEGRLTCSQSTLIDVNALIEELKGTDILIGKPLHEVQAKFADLALQWSLPAPSLDPILAYLEAPEQAGANPRLDLIYLHKP